VAEFLPCARETIATNANRSRYAHNANPTYVTIVTATTEFPTPSFDQAKEDFREGIEHSRVLVRRSRVLIELSETDGVFQPDDSGEFVD
jgi:hypothetical protein